jgi:membrane protease YdiL (CAAX protease family)
VTPWADAGAIEPAPLATASPVTIRDRVASAVEVVLCSGFPTQLLVTVALAGFGVAVLLPDGRLSLRSIAWLSSIDTILVVALATVFLRSRGERPADVFRGGARLTREAALGVLLLPLAFVLIAVAGQVIEWLAPWLKHPDGNPLASLLRSPSDIVIFALVAVFAGGLREELQRAFILHRFEQHLGGAPAGVALFSLAFGLGHSLQGWDAAILTGLLGVFWGLIYLWRRSVVAPVVCHAAFNLVEVVYHGIQA